MSSLIRRIEKRALKRAGFTRQDYVLVRDPETRKMNRKHVRQGGMIHSPSGKPIGYRWPRATCSGV